MRRRIQGLLIAATLIAWLLPAGARADGVAAFTIVGGGSDDGVSAMSARIPGPPRIAFGAGRLHFVTRGYKSAHAFEVRAVALDGSLSTALPRCRANTPAADPTCVFAAHDVADDRAGTVYVADRGGHRVTKLDVNGIPSVVADWSTQCAAEAHKDERCSLDPVRLAPLASGGLAVLNEAEDVLVVGPNGSERTTVSCRGAAMAIRACPKSIASDDAGRILFADGDDAFRVEGSRARRIARGPHCVYFPWMPYFPPDATCFDEIYAIPHGGIFLRAGADERLWSLSPRGKLSIVRHIGVSSITVDNDGTMIWAGNGRIWRKTASGDQVIAGEGSYDGALARSASVEAADIALGPDGALYLTGNGLIYRVDPVTQELSVVAGKHLLPDARKPVPAKDGALAHGSYVGYPASLAFDGAGNLYFTSNVNTDNYWDTRQWIRVIDAKTGRLGTYAGNGGTVQNGDGKPARQASIAARVIRFSPDGRLFLVENDQIRLIDRHGIIRRFAGTGSDGPVMDGGPAVRAHIYNEEALGGIAFDAAGNVYVADFARIRRVDARGIITTFAGSRNDLNCGAFCEPGGLQVVANTLYSADRTVGRVMAIDLTTGQMSTLTAKTAPDDAAATASKGAPTAAASFSHPDALAADATSLYVAESVYEIAIRDGFEEFRSPRIIRVALAPAP